MSRSPLRVTGPARYRAALVAIPAGLALTLMGCSAGQITQTADQRSTVAGANYEHGDIKILNATIEAPGPEGWAAGDTAGVQFTVVNAAASADEITAIELDGVSVTLAGGGSGSSESESAQSTEAAASGAAEGSEAPAAAESEPLEVPEFGSVFVGEDGDAQATYEVSDGPLYTGEALPITITFKNAGELSFDIVVGSSLDEEARDPSSSVNLHHGGGHEEEGEGEGSHG